MAVTTNSLSGWIEEHNAKRFIPEHELVHVPFAVGYWFRNKDLYLISSDRDRYDVENLGPLYTAIMEIAPEEALLDHGRFAFFSPDELEYTVSLRGYFNKLVDRSVQLDRLIQWIVLQEGTRWSMRWLAPFNEVGYAVRFSFASSAAAVGFKLTWNDEVLD